jgi:hypothetical protein
VLGHQILYARSFNWQASYLNVFDVNVDWTFNETDVDILYKTVRKIEAANPELVCGFGIYLKACNGYLTRHMIHIDICPVHTKFYK